jgi:hypothetical protein
MSEVLRLMKDEGSWERPVACPRNQEANMRRLRFSIASLLGVVLFISVALGALRAADDAWNSGMLSLDLLILLTAILLGVHRTDRKQAYWLVFSLFGWVYLLASMIPPIGSRLPTTKGLAYVRMRWISPLPAGLAYFDYDDYRTFDLFAAVGSTPDPSFFSTLDPFDAGVSLTNPSPFISTIGPPKNFVRFGHSLLALVMALIGGRLSRWMYDKNHVQMAGGNDLPTEERRR